MKNNLITYLIIAGIFLAIGGTVASNYAEQYAIDRSKLPERVEDSSGFQRWITNQKKRMEIEAEEFRFKEKNEVFNAEILKVTKIDTEEELQEVLDYVALFMKEGDDDGIDGVAISPSKRQFLDYRHEPRDDYSSNEIRYYGLRDERLIDTRILTCPIETNCRYDRAYFIDNDSFVISELSRNIDKKTIETDDFIACGEEEICEYTFKLHFIDLKNSERLVYESKPFDAELSEIVQYF